MELSVVRFSLEKSIEDNLYKAILDDDQDAISQLLSQGANPNKSTCYGKTCLGLAAYMGKISIVKLFLDASKSPKVFKTYSTSNKTGSHCTNRKRHNKLHKRKHEEQYDETVVKYKNLSERKCYMGSSVNNGTVIKEIRSDNNQGYFEYVHSEGSSSDEGRIPSLKSPLTPPSPQADLEWDEEIGNVAPTTSEDETWSSMYLWYAMILESTGAAIEAASGTFGIDQQDSFMKTALHYAAMQGHEDVVKLLMEAGCKIEIASGDGLTPLHLAVRRNHAEVAKILLAAGSNVNYKTYEKMTPLHYAASRGNLDMVKILVNNGAYLEARDTSERTALYLAAGRGLVDVVKYLISSGSNVNGEDIHGYTPLCEAVWQTYAGVVEVLLASGARIPHTHKLLHDAVIRRQVEIVRMFSNLGGGINLHNDNGDTPLLLASRLSEPAIANVLLKMGANINACNSITGANSLHIAVENIDSPSEFLELLICLLEYNIDMNSTALTGDTALNRALLLKKDHAAVLLIRYGADVNACDIPACGLDNMSVASRRRSFRLACMLLKAGHSTTLPAPGTKIPKPGCAANWLYYASKQPLSLSDLCRIKIRHLSKNRILFRFIDLLPLPKSIKRFLMMEDEGL